MRPSAESQSVHARDPHEGALGGGGLGRDLFVVGPSPADTRLSLPVKRRTRPSQRCLCNGLSLPGRLLRQLSTRTRPHSAQAFKQAELVLFLLQPRRQLGLLRDQFINAVYQALSLDLGNALIGSLNLAR